MPAPWLRWNRQTALLWTRTGTDSYGQPTTVTDPVELSPRTRTGVRWNVKRSEILDAQGNSVSLDAQAMVDREIEIGSYMWLGTLNDWIDSGSDSSDQEIHEVKVCDVMRDIKGRAIAHTVGLMRLHNRGTD